MQPSGGVAQHHIHVPCLGRLQSIKQYRAGIRALMLPHDIHAGTARPDLQLVGGRRTERIAGAQQDLFALILQLLGQLADGCGLAHAVDADDQHHGGLALQHQRAVTHLQLALQDVPQGVLYLVHPADKAFLHPLPQLGHGISGGVSAYIGQDQRLLQSVVELVVQVVEGRNGGERLLKYLK